MSAVTEAPVELARPDPRSLPGETGMVERPRRRLLPFDPWHLFLLPLVWMVVTSLETEAQTFHFPPILWPGTPQFGNYLDVIRDSAFTRWFWNTTVVTVTVVASNLVLCTLAAYAFARIRFLGRAFIYFVILATLMVPLQVVLIPTFLLVKDLGLLDRLGALVVPNLVNVFGIFLLTQFFRTLPIDLEEAARIDGASRLSILLRIVVPLSLPALATLAVIHPDEPGRVHPAARARHLPGFPSDPVAPGRGREPHVDGADDRAVPARAAVLRARHRHPGTEGLAGWPGSRSTRPPKCIRAPSSRSIT